MSDIFARGLPQQNRPCDAPKNPTGKNIKKGNFFTQWVTDKYVQKGGWKSYDF